jgi:hypothetical protein
MANEASRSGTQRRRRRISLRPLFSMVVALAGVVGLWLYASGRLSVGGGAKLLPDSAVDANSRPGEPRIVPLRAADRDQLRRQRALVDDLARRYVGISLQGGSLEDLRVLQQILDRAPPPPDETYTLQAFGVALGDVLAKQLGLDWAIYEDELGRSRALGLGGNEAIFPVTMISKRVELGVPFTVDELYQKAVETVEQARARGRSKP